METRRRQKLLISDVRSLAFDPHGIFSGFDSYVVCEACFGLFYTSAEYERHVPSCPARVGDENVPGTIECLACNETFTTSYEYNVHNREKHLNVASGLQCVRCSSEIDSSTGSESNHCIKCQTQLRLSAESSTALDFVCSRCEQRFATKTLLRDHQIREYPHVYSAYACRHNGCGMRFGKHEDYTSHLSKEHSLDFVCKHCDMSYASKEGLRQHIRSHTGEKPFKCDYCGRSFAVKDYLVKHIRTHTGEKPYRCVQGCGARFSQPSSMNVHMRRSCPAVKGKRKRGRPKGSENRVPEMV